jgi:polar amino acid transport system substrate-binding protein
MSHLLSPRFIIGLWVVAAVLSGCGTTNRPALATATPADDLLSKILARGTIVMATDPGYPPQSERVPDAVRPPHTKCAPNEATAQEFRGFDIAVAVEVAKRLGVEPCFVTPQWSQLIAGNWDGRWDISIGSMTITEERMKVLYFGQPYYSTPVAFFVHKDNTRFAQPSDLSGHQIGTCTGCAYEDYLHGRLSMPNNPVTLMVQDAQIVSYQVDVPALEDLAVGDGVNLDAVITGQPTGLQAIKNGLAIRQLGEPVFYEFLAPAFDKKSNQDARGLAARVSELIQQMHADGALVNFSQTHFAMDYTTVASQFDIAPLGQLP